MVGTVPGEHLREPESSQAVIGSVFEETGEFDRVIAGCGLGVDRAFELGFRKVR